MRSTTSVHYWRFEDGETIPEQSSFLITNIDPMPRGWYCWVYPSDDHDFIEWMKTNCPTADHTFRFNSGDPMHTVYISSDVEATLFSLKYVTHGRN
jgi:hypothetical protein